MRGCQAVRGCPESRAGLAGHPDVRVCPGEDADLCSELLQESLDALRALPEASLFDENTVSSVWLEVVERAARFLRSVVTG